MMRESATPNPKRRPARPYAFENVRSTIRFGYSSANPMPPGSPE